VSDAEAHQAHIAQARAEFRQALRDRDTADRYAPALYWSSYLTGFVVTIVADLPLSHDLFVFLVSWAFGWWAENAVEKRYRRRADEAERRLDALTGRETW
jgi:hypothetical protein